MRFAGLHKRIEDLRHVLHRCVQFPAELAHIIDAQGPDPLDAGDLDLLRG